MSPGLELFATTKVIHQRVLKTKPLEDIGNFKVADSVYICSLFSNTHLPEWFKIAGFCIIFFVTCCFLF